ncbi:hypothetical protein OGAPHI_000109 [Ogataea philodendri]|uniref:Uncharacterized protein n=1 Tax=Ogataea philodendri TaxID=1378263 RepID=A0A9P8PGM1_9ASCO|nr:uncharacterized protein OGAPHI_000109 [Ogataea philodendri]KAH3671923.1 hypothetical protein OGAPHI_000109 [Ogataea philodendri]
MPRNWFSSKRDVKYDNFTEAVPRIWACLRLEAKLPAGMIGSGVIETDLPDGMNLILLVGDRIKYSWAGLELRFRDDDRIFLSSLAGSKSSFHLGSLLISLTLSRSMLS